MKTPSRQTATAAKKALRLHARKEAAEALARFFKTGPGQYGEGDRFIGVKVPDTRSVAREFRSLDLGEIQKLLRSKVHEERLLALIVLTHRYSLASKLEDKGEQARIFAFYVEHFPYINNWDLVDTSAEHIVGRHLRGRNKGFLYRLARSKRLWERRIAILSTFHFIRNGELDDTFAIAEALLHDEHDLIHKAVGWMLREAGKRSQARLTTYLDRHAPEMPRTMLRYAIEKLSATQRKRYLAMERKARL